jgi:hypothetical protein
MTRRTFTLVTCASIVLTLCVVGSACSSRKAADSRAQDLAEIEKVHRRDVEATLAGDQAAGLFHRNLRGVAPRRRKTPEGKSCFGC